MRINPGKKAHAGLSMVEMLIVIAILGVLSGIAMVHFKGLTKSSENIIKGDFLAELNTALRNFEQNNWTMNVAAQPNSVADELSIIRSLQWKDPNPASGGLPADLGAPYFRQDWNPQESSDSSKHRIQWNGGAFMVLYPDTAGKGLRYDPADFGANYAFPNGYQPAGR